MKVIHINTFDIRGGAARAAYRIHSALKNVGVDSTMIVSKKYSQDKDINIYDIPFLDKKMSVTRKILSLQKDNNRTYHTCNFFYSGISKVINNSDADIIHLHWIGNEMISIKEISEINKKMVWTLHDMWAFCGTEHYDDINNQGRYRIGYSDKKIINKWFVDVNSYVWKKKNKYWKDLNFKLVSPSNWLAKCSQNSALFFEKEIAVIPNCINTNIFCPKDKIESRKKIGLPEDIFIILFGADGGKKNPIKGFNLLCEAIDILTVNLDKKIEFVVFGGELNLSKREKIDIREIGKIDNDEILSLLYSASDIFVIPSMMDNLPNTVMESMSCGIPCVGFNIGGIPDMIDHKINGYLAEPFNTQQLAHGMKWMIDNSNRLAELSIKARSKVIECYTYEIVAKKYIELYNICNNGRTF